MLKIGIECESIEGRESWGVGRIVKKLLEEIARRPELEKEFKFFLYFKSQIPDYPWLASSIFVKKIILKHSNILRNVRMNSFSLYYYLLLPIKLWFEKLDIMFFPNYMLSPLFSGKSLVMLTEDIYYEINSGTLPWRYKLAYKIFAGWAANHATQIMTISETSKKEVVKLFKIKQNRIVVNTLGIDPPKIITRNQQPETSNYILYVGQAFPRRHLRETMLAFELLALQATSYQLPATSYQFIAVGKDKYNPPVVKKLAEEINNRLGRDAIIYKEYVSEDELAQLYAHAKLLVYVSSKEAFGLPPLEALSCGIPAVVSDSEIGHEIFGDNAFFACPVRGRSPEATASSNGVGNQYSPETIADAMKNGLVNEQKREKIKKSAGRILEKYTWERFTDRFLNFVKTK